jgi:ankyrin repeat protein
MAEKQIGTLIDPKKKAMILDRIKRGLAPLFADVKPEPEEIRKEVKKPAKKSEQDFNGLGAPHGFQLKDAAKVGDCKMIRRLLDAGIDSEWMDSDRSTPLMYAAREGRVEALKLLISRGANINKVDGFNMTALGWAKHGGTSGGCSKCAEILRKHRAIG